MIASNHASIAGLIANPSARWDLAEDAGAGSQAESDVIQQASAGFLGHSDWVNDVVLVNSDVAASCSSDRTIRLWQASATGLYSCPDANVYMVTLIPRQHGR